MTKPESVWDYPRPPRLEPVAKRVRVVLAGQTIAETARAYRILETSHPPTIYIPREDIIPGVLETNPRRTFCEFKGSATYWNLHLGNELRRDAAWSYENPSPRYAALKGYVSFYPSRVDACYLDDEQVRAQEGDFYGGWITSDIVGPFKGGQGTSGW